MASHPLPVKSQRSTADYSLSCAECRRLKLKCSRQQWPCETCVKRGIAHLCPDGVQRKEKGTNQSASTKASSNTSNIASTSYTVSNPFTGEQALHNRLENLERKIDQLILASSGSSSVDRPDLHSNGSLHHLASIATNEYSPNDDQDEEARQQHGTLTMHPDGRAHYIGSNAQSMYLAQDKPNDRRVSFRDVLVSRPGSPTPVDLEAAVHPSSSRSRVDSQFGASPEGNTPSTIESQPTQFVWATPGFRSPHSSTAIWNQLKPVLPTRDTALRMVNVYYATVTFMFHPITRADFDSTIWTVFYPPDTPTSEAYAPPANFHPHKMALLYSVLSVGVLMDVRRPQRDPVGRALYSCAWNALAMSNFTEATSLESILALMHIMMYLTWRRGGKYAESAYPLLGTMMRMAISTGLHRDPSLFGLDVAQQEKRRRVFWDIQCSDVFRAFAFCRPPALCDRHVDTKLPMEWQLNDTEEGKNTIPLSPTRREGLFHHFKCEQIKIINQMLDECLCIRPTYQLTMRFDENLQSLYKKMHAWMMPALVSFESQSINAEDDLEKTYSDIAARDEMILEMQRHTTLLNHHQALLLLHRSWFSRALHARDQHTINFPNLTLAQIQEQNPLFASITTVNESASIMITILISVWCKYPALVIRWAFFWNAIFSAAVCRGLYVLKCRRYKTEEIGKAFSDLQQAVELFSKAVIGWAPLEAPLAILQRLLKRAQMVMNGEDEKVKGGAISPNDLGETQEEDIELIGDERHAAVKDGKRSLPDSAQKAKKRQKKDVNTLQLHPQTAKVESLLSPTAYQDKDIPQNDNLLALLPSFDFSSQQQMDDPFAFAQLQSSSTAMNPAMLPPLFGNAPSTDPFSGSASASQLIQMLSNGLSWDDVSSWNDLIVDL
jgi:hypothetical protein